MKNPKNDSFESEKNKKVDNSLRIQILQHVKSFSVGALIGGIGRFFNNYFGALFLGPTIWGIWQGAKLVLLYGGNLHLGVINGMHREIPILRGKKKIEQQIMIADVTFTFSFIIAIVSSLGILVISFFIVKRPELKLSLQFISAILFFQYIKSFYGTHLRANNEFNTVSKIAIIDGLGNLFSVALILFFGLLGFLGGQVLCSLVTASYSWWKSSYTINWRWDNIVLKSLIIIGFSIMLMIFANIIFTTIDRLLILNFLSAKDLGFYSLGNLVFAPLLMIFTAGNSVMYPRFAEKYGETTNPLSLKRYITIPMENLSASIPIIIGIVYIALPFLITVFLPKYVNGIQAAQILIIGLFFYGVTGMAGNMLLTINKQVLNLKILSVSAILNLIFSYIALKLNYGIVGVALGTSLGYFIYFLTTTILAMKFARASLAEIRKLLMNVIGPIFYVGIIVIIFSKFMPIYSSSITSMINKTIFQELIFLCLNSYFIYRFFRGEIVNLIMKRKN